MSNLHSKQTGTQLHLPKNHSEAEKNSVLTKTLDNSVGYVSCYNNHSTVITPVADVGGSTNNKYWTIYNKQNSKLYAVWYNVDSGGTFTLPDGYDELIEVPIGAGANVETIIDRTVIALNTVSSGGNYVLYDSITDGTTILTIEQNNSSPLIDATTGWNMATTTTQDTYDKTLVSRAVTGKLEFVDLAETIADTVGAMVTGNTETNITVTYDDADNTLDFAVSSTTDTNYLATHNRCYGSLDPSNT